MISIVNTTLLKVGLRLSKSCVAWSRKKLFIFSIYYVIFSLPVGDS